jgi:hypothetical protein
MVLKNGLPISNNAGFIVWLITGAAWITPAAPFF